MTAKDFLKSFRDVQSNTNTSRDYIYEMYYHLFSCFFPEEIEDVIDGIKYYMKRDGKYWFTGFHKQIRQTDFFDGTFKMRLVDSRTNDDKKREEELKLILPRLDNDPKVVSKEDSIAQGYENELKEYYSIKRKSRSEEKESICGHLDMTLWNLIYVDKENLLMKHIEKLFKEEVIWQ